MIQCSSTQRSVSQIYKQLACDLCTMLPVEFDKIYEFQQLISIFHPLEGILRLKLSSFLILRLNQLKNIVKE